MTTKKEKGIKMIALTTNWQDQLVVVWKLIVFIAKSEVQQHKGSLCLLTFL